MRDRTDGSPTSGKRAYAEARGNAAETDRETRRSKATRAGRDAETKREDARLRVMQPGGQRESDVVGRTMAAQRLLGTPETGTWSFADDSAHAGYARQYGGQVGLVRTVDDGSLAGLHPRLEAEVRREELSAKVDRALSSLPQYQVGDNEPMAAYQELSDFLDDFLARYGYSNTRYQDTAQAFGLE